MRFIVAKTELRYVTKFYEVDADDEDHALDLFYEGSCFADGFSVGEKSSISSDSEESIIDPTKDKEYENRTQEYIDQ